MFRYILFGLFTLSAIVPLKADNIGVLVMATGKYIQFIEPLVLSAEKYFCRKHNVKFFVFSDKEYHGPGNVEVIYQPRLGWPYDTMMRFQVYYDNRDHFQDQDYLYACDADMLFVGDIGNEILSNLVAVLHPGFYAKPRSEFSYDKNPQCLAFIKPKEGKNYFCGGFYGGKRKEVMKLAKKNSENITKDLEKGIIAVWHDESHLNRYFIDNPPTLVLSPAYCFPENWPLPFTPLVMALDKNHAEMRK